LLCLQGQLLGVGGATLRRIKQQSGTKIEVMDANGNLNGAHPDPLDPELHVLIVADTQVSLGLLGLGHGWEGTCILHVSIAFSLGLYHAAW
jgi:hypothetical protein